MKTIQIIELDGHPAALVTGGQAIIADRIIGADRVRVQAMALYALQIRAGERGGPYTDAGAERYAASVGAPRHDVAQPGRRRRPTPCRARR